MTDQLMAKKVKVDPTLGASALGTAKQSAIKLARQRKISYRYGKVERTQCHVLDTKVPVQAQDTSQIGTIIRTADTGS